MLNTYRSYLIARSIVAALLHTAALLLLAQPLLPWRLRLLWMLVGMTGLVWAAVLAATTVAPPEYEPQTLRPDQRPVALRLGLATLLFGIAVLPGSMVDVYDRVSLVLGTVFSAAWYVRDLLRALRLVPGPRLSDPEQTDEEVEPACDACEVLDACGDAHDREHSCRPEPTTPEPAECPACGFQLDEDGACGYQLFDDCVGARRNIQILGLRPGLTVVITADPDPTLRGQFFGMADVVFLVSGLDADCEGVRSHLAAHPQDRVLVVTGILRRQFADAPFARISYANCPLALVWAAEQVWWAGAEAYLLRDGATKRLLPAPARTPEEASLAELCSAVTARP